MATSAGVNASSGRRGYLRYLYGNHFWIPELLADFTRGIVRDTTRDAMPTNAVYDSVDFLLDRPGVAYKRGGSAFQHTAPGGMASLIGVAAPEYPGNPRVVAFASDGGSGTFAYDVTTGTPGSSLNCNGALLLENPPLHKDKLIVCDGKGAIGLTPHAVQKLYLSSGTLAVADLGGAPPVARYSCVHLSHLVLANSVANPNRVWFSPIPNIEGNTVAITSASSTSHTFTIPGDLTTSLPVGSSFTVTGSTSNNGTYTVLASSWAAGATTVTVASVPSSTGTMGNLNTGWDTANAWFDVPHEIMGLASLQGVLIIFCRGESWRILGDVPPGQTGANMQREPLAAVGCVDARSIVKMNGLVYWAHESGMYYTNGAAPASITHLPNATGIGNLWADALYGYSPQLNSVVCAGVYLNKHLFVTVRHAATDPQAGARYQFLYYQPTGSWVRLADGVTADMYATAFAPSGEIYASCGDTSDPVRALKLSGLFKPTGSNKTDANGDVVAPTVTFRTLTNTPSLTAWGRARLTYDMRDAASDNPTLAVAAAKGMEATSFATASTLVETLDTVRQRFSVACDSQAMTIRLTQSNASAMTELHALEVESRPYPRAAEGV
jgi:hypothetical protein